MSNVMTAAARESKRPLRHFLSGEELSQADLRALLQRAEELRIERAQGIRRTELAGQSWVLLFDKPSLRTRISFSVAISELGGNVIESMAATRKKEEPEDVARVLAGYCHGVVLRTHDHDLVSRMAAKSSVPVINGLSDSHHPCQVLADLLTLQQSYKDLKGLKLAYIGDGNNMLHSLLLLAPYLGVELHYSCPRGYEPNAFFVRKAKARAKEGGGSITAHAKPEAAVKGAHALYTDVWTSMGFEQQEFAREKAFEGYQLNEALYALAAPGALIMHCMPMVRGKEISEGLPEHENSALFRQSENRLHAQKALLLEVARA